MQDSFRNTKSYQVAIPVSFVSFRSKSFGLAYCWVHSHWKTTAVLFNTQHSIQFARIKRSFISARVLISTFDGLTSSSRMACWVRTLMVKVPLLHQTNQAVLSKWWYKQQNYDPFVSCWDLPQSAKAASKATAEMQGSADSNNMPSIFQLIVGSKQTYRRKPQQDLVDSSSLKTIIFETSDAFSRWLIVTFIKPNSNFPLSKSSLQSAPNSLFERNDKFIVVSKSRAPNESVSNKDFQLVVNSKSILNSEGARAVPITSYSVYEGAQQHSSGNATEPKAESKS